MAPDLVLVGLGTTGTDVGCLIRTEVTGRQAELSRRAWAHDLAARDEAILTVHGGPRPETGSGYSDR